MIDRETDPRPQAADGRNIDEALGGLRGEGAGQQIRDLAPERPYERRPSREDATADEDSYYGLPLLKEVVWKWPIPAYLYVGGLSGASAAVAGAALLRDLRGIVRAGRLIAAGGAMVSAALLIQDLGIRRRFIYMLRVFRLSSPMNVGTWILSAFGAAAGAAVVLPGALGDAATAAAGVAGLPLCGYTGVLVANTAVPLWQEARNWLPPLFCASAAASAGSAMELLALGDREQRAVRRLAVLGKAAELVAEVGLERHVSRIERVGRPLKTRLSGALWKAAKVCTLASLAISLVPRKSRAVRIAGGLLGTAGAVLTRFSLFQGGKASARDPHAVFAQQRAGHGAAEVTFVPAPALPSPA